MNYLWIVLGVLILFPGIVIVLATLINGVIQWWKD